MALQVTLPSELAERLRLEAQRRGQPTELVALALLDKYLPPASDDRRAAAVALPAQALMLGAPAVIVATSNVGHW
jgi:hypothetical protein